MTKSPHEMEMSEEQIGELKLAARLPISLETPIGEDGDTEIGHLIPDDDAVEPVEAATSQMLTEHLEGVLEMLDPREQKILRMRHGLDDDTPRTLDQVGQEFGLTRERIRQIESQALRRLRHPRLGPQAQGLPHLAASGLTRLTQQAPAGQWPAGA